MRILFYALVSTQKERLLIGAFAELIYINKEESFKSGNLK